MGTCCDPFKEALHAGILMLAIWPLGAACWTGHCWVPIHSYITCSSKGAPDAAGMHACAPAMVHRPEGHAAMVSMAGLTLMSDAFAQMTW